MTEGFRRFIGRLVETSEAQRFATAREALRALDQLEVPPLHPGFGEAPAPEGIHNGADFDKWREVMDVNLFGSLAMTRACVPHMEATGDGRVVMMSATDDWKYQHLPADRGWSVVVPGIEVVRTPGDHVSLLEGANGTVLAERLRPVLERILQDP